MDDEEVVPASFKLDQTGRPGKIVQSQIIRKGH
jgi:hypothetical protein